MNSGWWVVCLCAQWCVTCREYRSAFEALAGKHRDVRFEWVDVEDDADILDDALEVENFPTVLIADAEGARFMGALPPKAGVLERLLESLRSQPAGGRADALSQTLIAQIRKARR